MEKREWLEKEVGAGMLTGLDDLAIDFYYMAMHDNGMDWSDADGYALLNTLFGYNIGADHARGIIRWLYEHDLEATELTFRDKKMMKAVCDALGYHLDFGYWIDEDRGYMTYVCMAVPKVKKLIDKMFDNGYTIDQVCGCICGLYQSCLIDDAQEEELYIYADPDDTMDIAPFEAWCEWEGENHLDYTKERRGDNVNEVVTENEH